MSTFAHEKTRIGTSTPDSVRWCMLVAFTKLVNSRPRPVLNGVALSPITAASVFWMCSVHTLSCVCASSITITSAAGHCRRFWQQAAHCRYTLLPGPQKHLRWGVPEGYRVPGEREPLHDDWLISAALAALLDAQPWGTGGEALIVPARDPLADLDLGF